ncbi:MAG: HAD-IA family hydrolase [Hydrogenophaga sp.]|uniref:HAD-IA family hydrolase n=1 Tax=Hydrogenophaga sp. TaxID=1904254 RepID=UPI001D6A7527|nr:HAD-IA family hydrolase [Hydrogenophaga sp.]MBX3608477.1 HAD-IA family hydrolase [Hydrogenophaga sp.]
MLQALIFDVDGTLADTERIHLEAFNHAFAEEGLDWHWDEALYTELLQVSGGKERMRHYWQLRHPDVTALDAVALQQTIDRLHELKTAWYEDAVNQGRVQLRPGVLRLIEQARQANLAVSIATTTSPVNIAALLRHTIGPDWRTHFAAIGDASSAPVKKPDPMVYRQVLGEMGLPASVCVAFEDSRNGLLAARGAGLRTIVTPTAFTAYQRFDGALRVLPSLAELDIGTLQAWCAPQARAA